MEIDDDGDGDGDEDDDDSDSYDNDDDYLDPIDDNGDDLFPGQEFSTLISGPYNEERADEALQVAISHRTLDNMITLKNSFAGHEQVLEYLHTHASSPALSSRDRLISVAMIISTSLHRIASCTLKRAPTLTAPLRTSDILMFQLA